MFAVVFLTLILFLLFQCYALHSVSGNLYSEIRHGTFWGLIFGAGIFLSIVGRPTDFFGLARVISISPPSSPAKTEQQIKCISCLFSKCTWCVVRRVSLQNQQSKQDGWSTLVSLLSHSLLLHRFRRSTLGIRSLCCFRRRGEDEAVLDS